MAKITIEELSGSLKEYLNGLGLTEAQVQELIDKFEDEKIGDISQLSTEEKGSLVGAINELFQSANNGKELIANAIGEPLDSNDTFSAMSTDINSLLSTFKTNMMNNGVTVESGDKFKQLIDKIANMAEGGSGKGVQYVEAYLEDSVYITGAANTLSYNFSDLGINFIPTFLIFSVDTDNLFINDTTIGDVFLYPTITETGFSMKYMTRSGSITTTMYDFKCYAIGVGEEDTTLRDSLASILQEEGVSVTEEDDMASLITKVDEEFTDKENEISNLETELAGKVTPAGTATAGNVLSGQTFINSTGQVITGTMANRGGAQTVTPGTSNKTLNAGYYSGNITIAGDADLVAANIVKGKNIFGVAGTCAAAPTSMFGTWCYTGLLYNRGEYTTNITHNKGNTNYSIVISSHGQMYNSSTGYNYNSSHAFINGSVTTQTLTFGNTVATYTITVTKNTNTLNLYFTTTDGYAVDVNVFIGIL